VPVTLAAVVLSLMALVGLAYAVATISTAPGTVSRFRAAAVGAASTDIDGYVSVIWIGAAIGTVLAVILVALYIVLALGLRRGSNASRIATWVVCGLGLLAGCGSMTTVLVERSGQGDPQSLGAALSNAYPSSWIGLNLSLAIAQMVGYVIVALLLLAARGAWFGRGPAALPGPGMPQPGYGAPGYGAPGYGAPGYGAPGYGAPGPGASGYGAPGPGTPGYGAPGPGEPGSGYSYGAPYGPGYPPAPAPGYPPGADQGYQPGAGQEWGPGPGQGNQPGQAAGPANPAPPPQQPGQPFGMPPIQPGQPPATASEPPPAGPDDEYWSRPSS
jgi:hypothetical protein